jgi:hypothetical protein
MVPKGTLKRLEKLVGKEDVPCFGVWAASELHLSFTNTRDDRGEGKG